MASDEKYSTAKNFIAELAGILTIIPLAPFICRYIPPVMIGQWNFDLVAAVLIAIAVVRVILWLVKPLIIPAFLVVLAVLTYNQVNDKYAFPEIINDYKTLAYQNWMIREEKQPDGLSINPRSFGNPLNKTSQLIKARVTTTDSVVRNFAVKHSLESFDDYETKYGMLTRYLSVFQYINTRFKYVPDSQRDEYFATPRETILNGMGGDCDDHAILMASCLMSIGARCRLVIIRGHMYPELFCGDKAGYDLMQQAVIQFFDKEQIDKIYYHEHDNEYWINLDYTARHPGGRYLNDDVRMVIDL
ncbi:hypothetical protein SAMN05421788_11877 [Filimonas lacunae]|uniref:Transglutaminase-like domain-containing protein n=2 Tax=Filimonas lacunae TaxID=477680 RepID=A0A1N7RI38_9BACT|nr:hypothetical protein SAMN05421788_11877 [Filimonas lacunae]